MAIGQVVYMRALLSIRRRDARGLQTCAVTVRVRPRWGPCSPNSSRLVDVIDFGLPSSLALSLQRALSDRLQRGLSLELPSRRVAFAVAYHQPGHSLALGRLWLDRGHLEALYVRRWAQGWMAQAATSIARPPPLGALGAAGPALGGTVSQLRLQAEHASARQSLACSYVSLGSAAGLQFCRRVTKGPTLWLGTEAYYAASETSGGCTDVGQGVADLLCSGRRCQVEYPSGSCTGPPCRDISLQSHHGTCAASLHVAHPGARPGWESSL